VQGRVGISKFRDHSLALLPTFALIFIPLHLPRLPLLPCTHKIAIGDSDLINVPKSRQNAVQQMSTGLCTILGFG
jgi:hypothetical protein